MWATPKGHVYGGIVVEFRRALPNTGTIQTEINMPRVVNNSARCAPHVAASGTPRFEDHHMPRSDRWVGCLAAVVLTALGLGASAFDARSASSATSDKAGTRLAEGVRSQASLDSPRGAGERPTLPVTSNEVAQLAAELHGHGWLVFSAKTERGDWDLFRMRPDGTDRHKFIDMPEFNEGGARFSPDGKRVLFYRLPQSDELQNNEYGTGELVIANADGSQPVVFGNEYAWATWSPDGRQVACLASKGIQIVDLATQKIVRQLPRKGIVSQLGWSPDGRWFAGTASHLGPFWNIARMDAETGEIFAVSETDRYNCTPDWVADSRRIVYARGIIPQRPGRAELWVATLDDRNPQPLYAEETRHIYGACASPDMKHLLFTRSVADLTKVEQKDTLMAIIRWADTPMRGANGVSLQERFPKARSGPRLDLGPGWEPFWTAVDLNAPQKANEP